jgi:hypothetical protein
VTPDKEIVWEFINPFYEFHDVLGWTNHVFQAHRYGCDYPGLIGKKLEPGKFELVLREKGKKEPEEGEAPGEKSVGRRLKMLGY